MPQRIFVEVAGTNHIEARRLQGLGDQAGVVGRGGERAGLVGAVADDERHALFRRGGICGWRGRNREERERSKRGCQDIFHVHGIPHLRPSLRAAEPDAADGICIQRLA
jgi:hypothetical protein